MGRRLSVIVAIVGMFTLVACAPEPAPAPSPTPSVSFATDAEAFAAAEATYRAYVDALNQVDLSDPETFEAVYAWTTGELNAEERENLTQMHSEDWVVTGDSIVETATASVVDGETVRIHACLDVSAITLVDSNGVSQVAPERPNRYSLSLTLVQDNTTTGFAIEDSTALQDERC